MHDNNPCYTVYPPLNLRVSVQLPASKSISNRVLILNALSKSPYPVENLSESDDTRVLFQALTSGATNLDIGAAGTSMRFLTAYLSQLPGEYTLTGTERMKNRPIRILVEALRQLGAEIEYMEKESYPPLHIKGKKLDGGNIRLDGSVSSQYISALMMIAPYLTNGLTLHLEGDIISQPYIRMTIRLMELFGVGTQWDGQTIRIEPQACLPVPFRVESDWSAASYWYEIRALFPGDSFVELLGLEENSPQGDAKVAGLFERLSTVAGRFDYHFVNEPDLAQTFVVTCCLLDIPFRFTGLQSLRIKETDRIFALQTEMKKLGYLIRSESDDTLEWKGEKCLPDDDPVIATYDDHRMAMAFAPVCLRTGKIRISNPDVVSKSYPRYWQDLMKAGFKIQLHTF
jgi:3-phosphoshikimate 1-carboxyvinyltransferase